MFNTFLIRPIFNLLAGIYAILPWHDFGIAIIVLTIIIRLLLWPLINKQLHSQRALQELQPELQRIKSEAKGDKQLEGKLTMELYKEREINPFASIIPLVVQLPIFFALFVVLRDIVKPGQLMALAYDPIKNLGPISQIIHSHTAFNPQFLGLVTLAKPALLFAVLAAAAQFIQTKQLQPKKAPNDAQAQMMASMTYLFPGLTLVIGLSLPSALALYWTTTSLVAIWQQYLILKRDVIELEEGTPESPIMPESKPALTASKPAKPKGKKKSKKGGRS